MTQFPRWIVAADSAKARLFVQTNAISGLAEVESLDHPEGRLQVREMVTDRNGRAFSSTGTNRSAMEPDVDPKAEAARRFSKQVVGVIESASNAGKFESLVIAAAPKFLGLLRDGLSSPVQRKVSLEIAKDLVRLNPPELLEQVTRAGS